MKISFYEAAIQALEGWLKGNVHHHKTLAIGSENEKLTALNMAAKGYKIIRNFVKDYDERIGLQRLAPVLEIIDPLKAEDFSEDLVGQILEVRTKLSASYGNRYLLTSATTKFLWIKFRSPIIIYDEQARKALKTATHDLRSYYDAWQSRYNAVQE